MEDKNFVEDMDLDIEPFDEDQISDQFISKPRNLREQHKAAKRIKRGPSKNQTYTIPVSIIEKLRQHVLKRKLEGEKISASQAVVEGIKLYLAKQDN